MNALEIASLIEMLKPGDAITLTQFDFVDIPRRDYNGCRWGAIDQIMSKVLGSQHSIQVREDDRSGEVTFLRLKEKLPENTVTYVEPDRKPYYSQRRDGLFELINEHL